MPAKVIISRVQVPIIASDYTKQSPSGALALTRGFTGYAGPVSTIALALLGWVEDR
jgi:hypothetical protein